MTLLSVGRRVDGRMGDVLWWQKLAGKSKVAREEKGASNAHSTRLTAKGEEVAGNDRKEQSVEGRPLR
jgi:hypothetical protein